MENPTSPLPRLTFRAESESIRAIGLPVSDKNEKEIPCHYS